MKKQTFPQALFFFITGIIMGIADTIPGISGGTIALIMGVYHRFIHSLNQLNKLFVRPLSKGKVKLVIHNIKRIDFPLFFPLGAGIILAILAFSTIISYLLQHYSSQTYSLFFGLILASTYVLFKQLKKFGFKEIIATLIGFLVAYLIAGATSYAITHHPLMIFVSGVIAISAMILPGISGAFLLVLLGQYQYLVNAIHEKNISVVLTFGLGAIVGLLSFSKLVDYCMHKYKNITIAFLIGIMLGALRAPLIQVGSAVYSLSSVIFAIIGVVLVIFLMKVTNKKELS